MVSSPFYINHKSLKSGEEKMGGIVQKMLILLHVIFKIAFFNIMKMSSFAENLHLPHHVTHYHRYFLLYKIIICQRI
jgi:hypothetical protein